MDFSEIYGKHFKDVYHFMLALCRNRTLAEEITQETFVKALENMEHFKGTCKINTWLCRIAKNQYLNTLDKNKNIDSEHDINSNTREDFVIHLLEHEDSTQIHKLIHEISEPYREVFTLRVFAELSFSQISELFGKTESWARVTFYRAKQQIISRWEEL